MAILAESGNGFRDMRAKVRKAVALAGEPERAEVPHVVATGRGAVAEQILQVAFASGVRVREDADLVEVLSAVDLDSEIPLEALAAVAEILAYVYRANGAHARPIDLPFPPEEAAP